MTDRAITAAEAAVLLGVTERYVWRLGREGDLPRVKHPGRKYVRFMESDVLAYRERGRTLATRERPTSVERQARSSPPSCSGSHAPSERRRF